MNDGECRGIIATFEKMSNNTITKRETLIRKIIRNILMKICINVKGAILSRLNSFLIF